MDDINLSGAVGKVEGRDVIQRDLDRLEEKIHVNLMRFVMLSAKSCSWVRASPDVNKDWGNECIQSSLAEKELGGAGE